jgi:phosphatidylglycerol:prolipoprotein diacylglycerol transferase
MLPTLFKIGPLAIHSYGLMIAIGFLVGLFFIRRDARKEGIDQNVITDMCFWGLLVAIVGTRLLYIAMFPEEFSWSDPIGWFAIWRGGLVFQGGPPAAIVFCYFYLKRKGLPTWRTADIILPYLPLGHAFGRLGCFLNGCCYGLPSDLPWAIPFRRVPWDASQPAVGSPVFLDHLSRFDDMHVTDHWSHAVHPTQLYESAALLVITGILLLLRKKWRPFNGFTLPAYLFLYGVWRFINEFFRGDHNPTRVGWMTDQQVMSLGFAVAALCFLIGLAVIHRRRAAKQ